MQSRCLMHVRGHRLGRSMGVACGTQWDDFFPTGPSFVPRILNWWRPLSKLRLGWEGHMVIVGQPAVIFAVAMIATYAILVWITARAKRSRR